jgi:tetrahydromethanopterin S-methyltransferase subunit G
MSELKLALAREKMERWEKIQHRLDTVQRRREQRIAELQRRNQEAKEKADKLERTAEVAAANIAQAVDKHLKVKDLIIHFA